MFFGRRILFVVLILILGLALTACQDKTESPEDNIFPIFGGLGQDTTPVIAKVGDRVITQKDLDLRFDELVPLAQNNFQGEEGKQLLLKSMIEDILLVEGALAKGLQNRQEVGRSLITHRRIDILTAMRNIGIPEDNIPTEAEYQSFFKDNRKEFMQEGMVRARHVECLTVERAMEAYKLIEADLSAFNFMKVASEYSINEKTKQTNAEVGWYTKTGIVGPVASSRSFIDATFDLEIGLHRPIQAGTSWHVVEILERQPGRPMTYNEARDIVKSTMLPAYYDGKIKDYVAEARKTHTIEFFGKYQPGKGQTPDALMKRAALVGDPGIKLDYYRLIYTDFPESERADDALFMCALVCMDTWADRRMAQRYLDILLEEYPASDLHEDAVFLKENLYKPGGLNPDSIEELRK